MAAIFLGLNVLMTALLYWILCYVGSCCDDWHQRPITLQWRHNGRDSISNYQPHDCLLNRLFRRRSKKTSKLRVTDLCAVNSPRTGEFPAQMASNAENVSIWWCHHDLIWWWINSMFTKLTTELITLTDYTTGNKVLELHLWSRKRHHWMWGGGDRGIKRAKSTQQKYFVFNLEYFEAWASAWCFEM